MRIAILNIQYFPFVEGGAEVSTQQLAESLAKEHEVYVICHGDVYSKEIINGVSVYRTPVRIKFHNKIESYLTANFKIQCYKNLKQILQEIKPDLLHTNNLHAFSVIVWNVAHRLNIPVVHTLRDYTLLNMRHKKDQFIVKRNSRFVDAITAPSKYTLKYFNQRGLFNSCKINEPIPNAIVYSKSVLTSIIEQKMTIPDNQKVKFAFVGRFDKSKGIDWLISVIDNMDKPLELHLFGKGELAPSSIEILNRCESIISHGFLDQESLGEQMKEMDVVVVPSLWDEPFGRAILDGYKYGCPVIVTDRGGMPEVVDHMQTGLILKDSSNEELTDAISFFCIRGNIKMMLPNIEPKLRCFDIEIQTKRFCEVYNSLKESV